MERLSAQIDGGVCLIRGEAGSGKSTLLALLEKATSVPVVRVVLEPAAEDAVVLLHDVREALGVDLSDEVIENAPPGETVARLRQSMAARAPLVLALDDAHHLTGSPPALATATALASELPPGVGMILASRGPVPLSFARLRAQGRLDELTGEDLSLSVDEVREVLAQLAPGGELDQDTARRVHEATSGWLVAVVLLAPSLRDSRVAELLEGLSAPDEPLADYLSETVLARLPTHIVDRLEFAAALEPFDRALLAEIAGAGDPDAVDAGVREHLLVAEGRSRFRFAARIGEILRRRLATRPRDWCQIHQSAARIYTERGDLEPAIHHHLEAGDEDAAVRLLVTVGYASLSSNRIRSLGRHLDRLDPSRVEATPLLRFARATLRMMRAETARAFSDFEAVARDTSGPLAAAAASRLAYLFSWAGRFADAEGWTRRALQHAPPLPDAISVYAHALLANALHHLGRADEGQTVERALRAAKVTYPSNAIAPFNEGLTRRLQGRHTEERALALAWIEREEHSPLRASLPAFLMLAAGAEVALGRFREGLGFADRGIALARSSETPWWAAPCQLARAQALAGLGRGREAREEADEALRMCRAGGMSWTAVETLLLQAALDEDPMPAIEEASWFAERTQHPALRARVHTARARAALDRGDPSLADRELIAAHRELGAVAAQEVQRSIELLRGRLAYFEGRHAEAAEHVVTSLREGPAVRDERAGLVPVLLELSVTGSAEARAQLREVGAIALPHLARSRARVAAALTREIYDDEAGPLEIRSFGRLQLLRCHRIRDRVAEIHLRTPKVAELLWLLLLGRGRPVSRDALLDALWPDTSANVAVNRLHVHLSYLRHGLEPHLIGRVRSRYVLRESGGYVLDLRRGSCDAFRFEEDVRSGIAACQAGDVERGEAFLVAALARHDGPLFGDQPVPERIEAERRRRDDLYVEATLTAAGSARRRGAVSTAKQRLESLLAARPTEEAAYRQLMELAADQGSHAQLEAIRDRCRRVLAAEFGVAPEPRTEALATALLRDLGRAPGEASRQSPSR